LRFFKRRLEQMPEKRQESRPWKRLGGNKKKLGGSKKRLRGCGKQEKKS